MTLPYQRRLAAHANPVIAELYNDSRSLEIGHAASARIDEGNVLEVTRVAEDLYDIRVYAPDNHTAVLLERPLYSAGRLALAYAHLTHLLAA